MVVVRSCVYVVYNDSTLPIFYGLTPVTFRVPPTYTLLSFLQELEDFFGGRVTLQHLERSLINLRQTGTVSELAIQF